MAASSPTTCSWSGTPPKLHGRELHSSELIPPRTNGVSSSGHHMHSLPLIHAALTPKQRTIRLSSTSFKQPISISHHPCGNSLASSKVARSSELLPTSRRNPLCELLRPPCSSARAPWQRAPLAAMLHRASCMAASSPATCSSEPAYDSDLFIASCSELILPSSNTVSSSGHHVAPRELIFVCRTWTNSDILVSFCLVCWFLHMFLRFILIQLLNHCMLNFSIGLHASSVY
jgi:hypothetical protein